MDVVGKVVRAALGAGLCVLCPGLPVAAQSAGPAARAVATSGIPATWDIAFIQTSAFRAGDLAGRFPLGSRLVRMRIQAEGLSKSVPVLLSQGMFAAADPQVSFDGSKLLFAGQLQRDTTWQVWEVAVTGGTPRPITHCDSDCVQPVYLADHEIAYTSLKSAGATRTSEVQVSSDDGSSARSITFGPGRFQVETALRSGRLLLSAEWPLLADSRISGARTLYVADPDGSGLMLLRQDDPGAAVRSAAVELADGSVAFVQHAVATPSRDRLAWIRPGSLRAAFLDRSLSDYVSVRRLDDESVLVARRGVGQRFDLYQVSTNGDHGEHLLYRDPHASSVQAIPLAAYPNALVYHSILHPDRNSGRVVCMDAYASEDFPGGRLTGNIRRVRALLQTRDGEQVLGDAPVERDGSFYATVPANKPIRFQLLGAKGEVLKQQRSWVWVRSGEDRGCVGCHESQTLAPENRSPMALQRLDTPTPLLGEAAIVPAARKAVRP